ncbi:phosphoglycolate phosphatase [Viridibacterium curvum]|uniref:phosphoglycolate phosphatase n=1 Tax=Viridibacterium curvum TaxID=1101404 RepID=A0ABP9QFX2_9RHOO
MLEEDIRCVLFDLDGTLADTAPDLADALNRTRIDEGLDALPLERLRPLISQGVRGLLRVSHGLHPQDEGYESLFKRVLQHYAQRLCVQTRLFDGIPELLDHLEAHSIRWGIVTNKHSRFTQPLVSALGLNVRAASVVSGDTTPRAKPAPDPLLLAAQQCGIAPGQCIYLGDDERDIVAAKAAGMRSMAVRWGYLGEDKPIEAWGADFLINHPAEVLEYLGPQRRMN